MKIGPGLDSVTQIGPLVSDEQLGKVSDYVAAGAREGATLFSGGNRVGEAGCFLEPTILTDTTADVGGPRGDPRPGALRRAVRRQRRRGDRQGSQRLGLRPRGRRVPQDVGTAHRVAKALKARTIGINTHHVVEPALPFGDFRQPGWGREQGWEAISLYTEVKSIGVAL